MRHPLLILLLTACCIAGCMPGSIESQGAVTERAASLRLARAHAHNDYEHARPLLDALEHGFSSVEADVYTLPGGLTDLYVAHDPQDIRPALTLRALYLEPLAQRIRENDGSVYGDGETFYLLVDIKTEAESTYAEIDAQLREYAFMLTEYAPDGMKSGAVTVAISGSRPADTMRAQALRYAGYDGRMSDLDSSDPASFMPLVSDSWPGQFSWNGAGTMPIDQRSKLRDQVTRAHAAGRRVRYYGTPDAAGPERDELWRELMCAGVDHINTDDLAGLASYLRASDPPKTCD